VNAGHSNAIVPGGCDLRRRDVARDRTLTLAFFESGCGVEVPESEPFLSAFATGEQG